MVGPRMMHGTSAPPRHSLRKLSIWLRKSSDAVTSPVPVKRVGTHRLYASGAAPRSFTMAAAPCIARVFSKIALTRVVIGFSSELQLESAQFCLFKSFWSVSIRTEHGAQLGHLAN